MHSGSYSKTVFQIITLFKINTTPNVYKILQNLIWLSLEIYKVHNLEHVMI